ncbi:unnamed protein product [Linum trigynum]|uniref:AP2/ERF domain-containing protein n=1 Tax=Linum trigynum TaxID=586398 RepID=A0AAV2FSK4_9ROSI
MKHQQQLQDHHNDGDSPNSPTSTSKKTKCIWDCSSKHPVYWGFQMWSLGKWVPEIRELRKKSRIWLGAFPATEMVARAHDVATLYLKGRSAILNFPDLVSSLQRPASVAPRDVQAATA